MEIKQIITATVAVILVCLVAMPIIDDASSSINTEIQNPTEKYIVINSDSTGTHTVEITESAVLWDGEPQQQYMTDNPGRCGNTEYLVLTSMSTIGVKIDLWTGSSPIVYTLNSPGDKVTFIDGTATIIKNGEEVSTTTYNTLIMPSVNGDYGLFLGNRLTQNPVHVDHGKPIYMIGGQYVSSTSYSMYFASITDGNSNLISGYDYNGTSITEKTYTITPQITKGDLSDTYSNIKVDGNNAFYVFAPLTYHVITDNQGITITLLELIPVLLIVAVLIGIGYSIMRRD